MMQTIDLEVVYSAAMEAAVIKAQQRAPLPVAVVVCAPSPFARHAAKDGRPSVRRKIRHQYADGQPFTARMAALAIGETVAKATDAIQCLRRRGVLACRDRRNPQIYRFTGVSA